MSLSISQKSRLFELIHELLDEHTEANAFYDEYGPLSPEQQEEFADRFDEKENELIAYVNTL
ncbi:Tk.2 conserved hypothetical protein [Escherichia phage JS10]|uniref:Uncharacterized protein tk.2 n=3 Tax=Dhakavirus TaxID=1914165 RepID=C4MZJ4_9CAUD|nr:Tk.2 conserved hypothetical protein [Escherichia phage JS98]YP_002922448.1 Tk.2 conserved hypothetical protein [Escherichia phage JS10]QIN95869.1 hypothetical protein MN04_00080 [Escherichia phage MN04]CAI9865935.1 hypothetical protein PFGHJN_00177 [Escherichia phage UP19]ABX11085.1 Tk.2 conserved hypothetical protein [Escherichia phage JS98]ACL78325.1 Tk.2 conserved hypothetical protein [Escherichia phage JS10]